MAFDPDEFIKKNQDAVQEVNPAPVSTTTSTFDPDQFIASQPDVQPMVSEATVSPPGTPMQVPPVPGGAAPQFYPSGPGMAVPQTLQTAKQVAQPAINAVVGLGKTYMTNPAAAVADVAMGQMGLPPMVATDAAKTGIQNTYTNVKDYLNKTGPFKPTTLTGGANPAWDAALSTPAKPVIGGPAAQEGASFIERITAKFAPLAARVAPVLNTVGRVAGPAGMAYNVYEAGKMANETQLGQRLAQGQGQAAPRAARDVMLNRNVSGYQPSAQEARNLLASGDQRMINIYGGQDRLRRIAGQ